MTTIDCSSIVPAARLHRLVARRSVPIRLRALTLAIATVALVVTSISLAPVQADTGDPAMSVTQTMVNRALQIMANKSAPVQQRRRQLREAIENEFDFAEMSKSGLGYHWRTLNENQRAQFTKLFTAFIEDAYLSKIQDYSGQQVRFLGQTPIEPGYVQINTEIVQQGKSPIPVNYLLLQKDGTWKIYDVTVDAISIIANYRNQFNRVINEKGFDQLMADLQAKQQELASLLGN
jgi:phospholipid transport system substrate-binding protein